MIVPVLFLPKQKHENGGYRALWRTMEFCYGGLPPSPAGLRGKPPGMTHEGRSQFNLERDRSLISQSPVISVPGLERPARCAVGLSESLTDPG